ncbi:MAG: GntR family transcriptional regulator [Pseudomonadota bacterium]
MSMPISQTIVRKSLHHELVDRLQTLILNSELKPGSKVPEKHLCDQFGVSRTPLREALKVMATHGLVRLEPNRGAWVTQVTQAEVEEVFPVLGALEALSGELACARITDGEIEEVRSLHAQMVQSYENRDLNAYFSANQQIHRAILMAARNGTLTTSCEALSLRMQRARYLANMSDSRWAQAVREHEDIMEHLSKRDGKRLARTLQSHMDAKRASVIAWLRTQNGDGALTLAQGDGPHEPE